MFQMMKLLIFTVFEVEQLKEIEKFIGHKNIKTNIYIIQANNSIMCSYLHTGFTDFMLKDKSFFHQIVSKNMLT